MIKAENLSFTYSKSPSGALKNLIFEIGKDEVFGLVDDQNRRVE